MKILIFNFEYPPLGGGGAVATAQIAEELAKRHTVFVLTTHYRSLAYQEVVNGVHVHRVSVWGRRSLPTASLRSLLTFVPAALWRGWRLCRREAFDVINAQFVLPSGLVGVLLGTLFSVPVVVSFVGGDLFDPTKGTSPHRHAVLRWLVRALSRRAQARTAISRDTQQNARTLHGVQEPIVVTPLGIFPREVVPAQRAQLALPERGAIFVSIGRLIPRKNYDLLLRAWARVPESQLVIIGSGPLQAKLERRIAELGLGNRVQLTGFVAEETKQQILQASQGYVSAADHEGFGLVFLEAMQAGLPIVATRRGGHTDFLRAGENALLVEPGDAAALAQAVRRLLAEAALGRRMGEANRAAVREFYLDKTVARFEDVLEQAVHTYAN